jgi:hypothetical protein
MDPNYNSVSSVTTLHALARAANCPSILDFLEGQANFDLAYPIVTAALKELLPAVGCHLSDATVDALGQAIGDIVVGVSEQGDGQLSEEMVRVLARAQRGKLRMVVP